VRHSASPAVELQWKELVEAAYNQRVQLSATGFATFVQIKFILLIN
jgi:xanthine dehydrogenase molybdopterin-binding subunit B